MVNISKSFQCFVPLQTQLVNLPKPLDKAVSVIAGEDWRRIRKTLSPLFTAHKLKGMTSLMNLACDTLMKKIDLDIESGTSVDILGYELFHHAIAVIEMFQSDQRT